MLIAFVFFGLLFSSSVAFGAPVYQFSFDGHINHVANNWSAYVNIGDTFSGYILTDLQIVDNYHLKLFEYRLEINRMVYFGYNNPTVFFWANDIERTVSFWDDAAEPSIGTPSVDLLTLSFSYETGAGSLFMDTPGYMPGINLSGVIDHVNTRKVPETSILLSIFSGLIGYVLVVLFAMRKVFRPRGASAVPLWKHKAVLSLPDGRTPPQEQG